MSLAIPTQTLIAPEQPCPPVCSAPAAGEAVPSHAPESLAELDIEAGYTQVFETASDLWTICAGIQVDDPEYIYDKKKGETLLTELCNQIIKLETADEGAIARIGNTVITSAVSPQFRFRVQDIWNLALEVTWIPRAQGSLAQILGTNTSQLARCKKKNRLEGLKTRKSQDDQQKLVATFYDDGYRYKEALPFLPWQYMIQHAIYLHSLDRCGFLHFLAAEEDDPIHQDIWKGRTWPRKSSSRQTHIRSKRTYYPTTDTEFIGQLEKQGLIPVLEYAICQPKGWITLHEAARTIGHKRVTLNYLMEALLHLQRDPALAELSGDISTFAMRTSSDITIDPVQLWKLVLSDTAGTERPRRFDRSRRKIQCEKALYHWWYEAIVYNLDLTGVSSILKELKINRDELLRQARIETIFRHQRLTEVNLLEEEVTLGSSTNTPLETLTKREQIAYFQQIDAMRETLLEILHENLKISKEKRAEQKTRIEKGWIAVYVLALHGKGLIFKRIRQLQTPDQLLSLYSSGFQGLIQAIGRYSSKRQTDNEPNVLSTVAHPLILAHVIHTYANHLGVSRATLSKLYQLRKGILSLVETLKKSPTLAEIAATLGIPEKKVYNLVIMAQQIGYQLSLNGENWYLSSLDGKTPFGTPLYDLVAANDTPEPSDPQRTEWLTERLASLPRQIQQIMILHFNGLSDLEITKRLKLKRALVKQILEETLEALRREACQHFGDDAVANPPKKE